jgi:hypothetical protein
MQSVVAAAAAAQTAQAEVVEEETVANMELPQRMAQQIPEAARAVEVASLADREPKMAAQAL